MSQDRDTNLALFIDFDNVALGARDAHQRFDINFLLQRILEKGKIIVKRAYADWRYYKEHMSPMHEAAIELIEIPMPRISGKNSADIRLVVDAMDLCYSKHHIDTFVIVSGDSDFSPLVSKLRENNKRVIGIGVKNSSSKLLIGNCDEFIFYEDIYREAMGQPGQNVANVPSDKRELFDFLVKTAQSLLQESRGVLYSSLIKDTMTRKQPDFNERSYGYSNFGDLLEDARKLGLLVVERDARAGGTWVVQGLGEGQGGEVVATPAPTPAGEANGRSRSSRRRRRGGRRKSSDEARANAEQAAEQKSGTKDAEVSIPAREKDAPKQVSTTPDPVRKMTADTGAPAEAADKTPSGKTARKTTKKTTRKPTGQPAKKTAKKTVKKTVKKTTQKKAPAKKTPAKKTTTKKTASKAPARKNTRKKSPTRKSDS